MVGRLKTACARPAEGALAQPSHLGLQMMPADLDVGSLARVPDVLRVRELRQLAWPPHEPPHGFTKTPDESRTRREQQSDALRGAPLLAHVDRQQPAQKGRGRAARRCRDGARCARRAARGRDPQNPDKRESLRSAGGGARPQGAGAATRTNTTGPSCTLRASRRATQTLLLRRPQSRRCRRGP